jgi:hypothetical protein
MIQRINFLFCLLRILLEEFQLCGGSWDSLDLSLYFMNSGYKGPSLGFENMWWEVPDKGFHWNIGPQDGPSKWLVFELAEWEQWYDWVVEGKQDFRLLPPLLLNKCDPDLDAQVEFVRHVQQLHRTANLEEIFWW